jgi:uncharacterized protein
MLTGGFREVCFMATQAVFHLSFPVRSLVRSLAFYADLLGGTVGRREPGWIDVILFGHQLTLHERPEQVLDPDAQGVRHFGALLDEADWLALRARAVMQAPNAVVGVQERDAGTAHAQRKLLLRDPDGQLLEFKWYADRGVVAPMLRESAAAPR